MSTNFVPKNPHKYSCILCDYYTSNAKDYNKHLLTLKHAKVSQATPSNAETTKKLHQCENCNKIYNDRSGLWRHKNKGECLIQPNLNINDNNGKKDELIEFLLKENKEFKELILEIVKKDSYNNSYNTTNSHNKAFNLNFFLNETCKDAMNIMDFVDSIKLDLYDLENVGEVGYIEGISNIIVKNLKELDVTKRPVHCTDKKRETMYIKDENRWEKDEENVKLHKLVKKVTSKNQRLIPKFKEKHPDCLQYHSKYSDQYSKIVYESMGGKGDDDYEKEEKIIKKIVQNVVIEK
jgi:hypothetical protein